MGASNDKQLTEYDRIRRDEYLAKAEDAERCAALAFGAQRTGWENIADSYRTLARQVVELAR